MFQSLYADCTEMFCNSLYNGVVFTLLPLASTVGLNAKHTFCYLFVIDGWIVDNPLNGEFSSSSICQTAFGFLIEY
jgi:hypothetical protein